MTAPKLTFCDEDDDDDDDDEADEGATAFLGSALVITYG